MSETGTVTPEQVLDLLIKLDNRQLETAANYLVGVIAYRLNMAGLNVTYPPVTSGDHDADQLVTRTQHFMSGVQRQVEFLRKHS